MDFFFIMHMFYSFSTSSARNLTKRLERELKILKTTHLFHERYKKKKAPLRTVNWLELVSCIRFFPLPKFLNALLTDFYQLLPHFTSFLGGKGKGKGGGCLCTLQILTSLKSWYCGGVIADFLLCIDQCPLGCSLLLSFAFLEVGNSLWIEMTLWVPFGWGHSSSYSKDKS